MPIYEYQCQSCGLKFETLRSMKDADSPMACKNCTSVKTKRLVSACFSNVQGGSRTGSSGGCAGCSGGSCSSCGH
jgi:putative FmdB family regulatory protein